MSAKPGFRLMWIGTVINGLVGIAQMFVHDGALIYAVLGVGLAAGVLGAMLASSSRVEAGRWLVFTSAVVFAPIGLIAALGVQRLRDGVLAQASEARNPT